MLAILRKTAIAVIFMSPFYRAVHDSLNFIIQPASRMCFYEDFNANTPTRTIEAFLLTGGKGDILLSIHGPLTLVDIREEIFEEAIVKERIDAVVESSSETLTFVTDFKPKDPGTYGICLDNRKSRFQSKSVQLDVRLAAKPDPIVLKLGGSDVSEGEEEELLAHAKESISRIKKGLNKIQIQQQRDRHRLSLHSEMNRDSSKRVLNGSIFETACFILAAIFQVFFVRRWFAHKLSGAKQWA